MELVSSSYIGTRGFFARSSSLKFRSLIFSLVDESSLTFFILMSLIVSPELRSLFCFSIRDWFCSHASPSACSYIGTAGFFACSGSLNVPMTSPFDESGTGTAGFYACSNSSSPSPSPSSYIAPTFATFQTSTGKLSTELKTIRNMIDHS
ncbi:uncharacterized protein [Gossypium hirsutum]|uniref:Uncharacterized protein isoform X2 n=1 Tax=Gossypium hirsutum TaxID=3635 RepID=A0A1U8NMF9_GOSHI|nr:uncharacterized protein LOC107948940 isoform X2 [Gossypium hirsutum]